MAAAPQTGMDKAEMRKLLMASKADPVNCAIGLGKDQSIGLLVMHRTKMGKMLEKQLIDDLPEAKNTRFGTVHINEDDPKQADFILNRPVSGMARKLVKTLKGTGFSKARIVLEDGTLVEGAADEEEEAAAAPATSAAPPPPPPPPQAAEPPAADASELARKLAALAPRIPQVAGEDAAKKAELLKLANLVNVNIKTNNLTYAATYLSQLTAALQAGPAAPPPAPPAPPAQEAAPDASALGRRLAALIPRVAAITDAAQKAELSKLAASANVNLKTNNLKMAAAAIDQLGNALDGRTEAAPAVAKPAEAPAAPPDLDALQALLMRLVLKIPQAAGDDEAARKRWMDMADAAGKALAGGDPVRGPAGVQALQTAMAAALQRVQQTAKDSGTYEKSGRAWLATRQRVEDELETLRATILATYEGQSFAAEIDKRFRDRTAPILRTLDASFATKLAAAAKADAAGRGKLIDEAETILAGYEAFAADPLLADLDDNPFAALSIRKTLDATLGALSKALV